MKKITNKITYLGDFIWILATIAVAVAFKFVSEIPKIHDYISKIIF